MKEDFWRIFLELNKMIIFNNIIIKIKKELKIKLK